MSQAADHQVTCRSVYQASNRLAQRCRIGTDKFNQLDRSDLHIESCINNLDGNRLPILFWEWH